MGVEVPTDELRVIFSTISGVPESRINWDGEPERSAGLFGSAGQAGKLTLNVVSRQLIGTEEMRLDEDDLEVIGAQRVLTISCRADNFLKMGEAWDTLEAVRLRFYRRSVRKALRDAGLSFVDAPSIVTLDYNVDNRAISSASLDIRFMQVIEDDVPQEGIDITTVIDKVSRKAFEDISDVDAEPVVYLPFKFP